jgi:Plavaka transposase
MDALLEEYDTTTLWDAYGIDADIIPFMRDFPRAEIHELLSSDLLHQAIKGSFKDHLVEWVGIYLWIKYGEAEAERIMDEIDRRYISSESACFYNYSS